MAARRLQVAGAPDVAREGRLRIVEGWPADVLDAADWSQEGAGTVNTFRTTPMESSLLGTGADDALWPFLALVCLAVTDAVGFEGAAPLVGTKDSSNSSILMRP